MHLTSILNWLLAVCFYFHTILYTVRYMVLLDGRDSVHSFQQQNRLRCSLSKL